MDNSIKKVLVIFDGKEEIREYHEGTGVYRVFKANGKDITKFTTPVKCLRCGDCYDLGAVTNVIQRYQDCTLYTSPCCNQIVDDRTNTFFKSNPDIEFIKKTEIQYFK